MIKVNTPKITVELFKLVDHSGQVAKKYDGSDKKFDITHLLGDGGSIHISKDIDQPCGSFSISFSDKVGGNGNPDTVYALIEPMDLIEIRASRESWKYQDGQYPLIMRGFVTTISRSEEVSSDGSPVRTVHVTGQDSGLLWVINNFDIQLAYVLEMRFISEAFFLQAAVGMELTPFKVSKFMERVNELIMTEKISVLNAVSSKVIPSFNVKATVNEGTVTPWAIGKFSGSYWDLLKNFCDRPWNELFIEDDGDIGHETPTIIFRPSPYKDINGSYIMQDAANPGIFTVIDTALVSLNVARSRNRVSNIYWVPPGATSVETNLRALIRAMSNKKMLDFDYGNNSPSLFGYNRMAVNSALVNTEYHTMIAQLPSDQRPPENSNLLLWYEHRRDQLRDLNRDNVVWEEGDAVVKGDEHIKPGRFVTINRGSFYAEYYCNSVSHNFSPLHGWTATLGLLRGTGFIFRRDQPGIYWKEGRKGPYSKP